MKWLKMVYNIYLWLWVSGVIVENVDGAYTNKSGARRCDGGLSGVFRLSSGQSKNAFEL